MDENEIDRKLANLFEMYKKLDDQGGPQNNGALFEEVLLLQDSILSDFGLTSTVSNLEYLMLYKERDDSRAAVEMTKMILRMQQKTEGEENLSSLEILSTGIKESIPPGNILPKMGILTHDYTFFLYNLLLEDPSLILEIYNELMRSEDYLEQIYLLRDGYLELKEKNIEFLDLYMKS